MGRFLTKDEIRETLDLQKPSSSTPVDEPAIGTSERPGHCVRCGQEIRTMVFRGTGYCSEMCEKPRENSTA